MTVDMAVVRATGQVLYFEGNVTPGGAAEGTRPAAQPASWEDWNCMACGTKIGRVDRTMGRLYVQWGKRNLQAKMPAHQRCAGCGKMNHMYPPWEPPA